MHNGSESPLNLGDFARPIGVLDRPENRFAEQRIAGGPAAIIAEGLTKIYRSKKNDVRALDGLDFSVAEGNVVGLLGPNGAGKTTTVRILTTLLSPDSGRATVAGFDVARQA